MSLCCVSGLLVLRFQHPQGGFLATNQVEAKLIMRTEKAVTLEKADGTQVTLLLEKLSQADRDLLRSLPTATEPEVDPVRGRATR